MVSALALAIVLASALSSPGHAQAPACTVPTSGPFCSPGLNDIWVQDTFESVIWNPDMTAPFDKYEKVDVYLIGTVDSRVTLLQQSVDLSLGMAALKLEAPLFPEDLPVNRSCHILLTRPGNALDGTHATLNSSLFNMIRTKYTFSGTLLPIPPSTISSLPSSLSLTLPHTTTSSLPTTSSAPPSPPIQTPNPESSKPSLSTLVIGLISAGSVALLIAIVAVILLLRARRRFTGNTNHFKTLQDPPGSPTDDLSKSSIFKHESDHDLALAGPALAEPVMNRSSSNTARSGDPMIKHPQSILGYNTRSEEPPSPTAPLPLLERNAPARQESTSSLERGNRPSMEPVLSGVDAMLIAETFRKSMRRPRWEDEEDEDLERDEARKAADDLLRKELSAEGVDVRRGMQRRVTIQDRTHRSSVQPPLSGTTTAQP